VESNGPRNVRISLVTKNLGPEQKKTGQHPCKTLVDLGRLR